MDSKNPSRFSLILLLIISSILFLQSSADGSGSVYFLDSSTHHYFQSPSSEPKSMSLPEVGAAISVLLGFAPPSTLSSMSSEKLNEVLVANPFNRPYAVFSLEINRFGDKHPELGSDLFSKALKREVTIEDAEIQLSDENELSLVSLNEPVTADMELSDADLTDFASWLGGTYLNTAPEPLTGELTVPLANGVQIKLHMSKKADREFTRSLIALNQNVWRAVTLHEDLAGSIPTPAELIEGRFDGLKAFEEHYGTDDIVQEGAELLVTALSKIYDSLKTLYKGQLVGVVIFNRSPAKESDTMLTVKFTMRPTSRLLEEKEGSHDASLLIAEVLLVRRTLAWITGIIFLISTLMGTWFLLYMPLTRDTLLYSNVKLD
uniref:uncharacterized protein LOC122605560 n=1 Tax=Erigeron canadensis TaxID=72917 RepID=UPI001CB94A2C|nr:uncharacterized protein LOC122605560 [Erigeron canadensis]